MSESEIFANRFELHEVLGEGGVARVYRATELKSGVIVAIKMLLEKYAGAAKIRRRFMREARAVRRLRHPNIVRLFEYGESDAGVPFIVMELVEGVTLSNMHHRLKDVPSICRLVNQVLAALSLSHSNGIVHRDVKPQNVVVAGEDESSIAKLLDFGFARLEDEDSDSDGTKNDAFGTPLYMSPEQVSNDHEVGAATDIYSVGIMLYELLSGEPPFTGAHGMAVALRHLTDEVPSLEPRPGLVVPEALNEVIMRALEKSPAARFPDAAAMRRAIMDAVPTCAASEHDETLIGINSPTLVLGVLDTQETAALPYLDTLGDEAEFQALGLGAGPQPDQELLVGRDAEREWLWQGVRSVARGEGPRLLCLGAQHGMGRRRLVAWLRSRVREDGRMQVLTLGRRTNAGEEYGGLRGLLNGLIGVASEDAEVHVGQLQSSVERWAQAAGQRASSLSLSEADIQQAARFAAPDVEASIDSGKEATEADLLIAKLVALSCLERPTILTVGGLERTGPGIVGFLVELSQLAGRLQLPLLLVVSYIDDPDNVVIGDAVARLVETSAVAVERRSLAPFGGDAMRTLLRRLAPLERTVEEAVAQRTEGNPFFATELIHLLVHQEELEERDGRLHLAGLADPSSWPTSLAETVRLRSLATLGRMPDGDFIQSVLKAASILGEAFDYDVLHDYLEKLFGDAARVERAIEGLVEANLLQEPAAGRGDRLHFVHPVVRTSMLELTEDGGDSPTYHKIAAEILSSKFAGHEGDVALTLAEHKEHAGEPTQAARYLLLGAGRARRDGSWSEARALLERAERLIGTSESVGYEKMRAQIWLELASVEIRLGRLERAQNLGARVYRWASERDEALSGRSLLVLGDSLRRMKRTVDAKRAYEKGVECFAQLKDAHGVARCLLGQAIAARDEGRFAMALSTAQQARPAFKSAGDERALAQLERCVGDCYRGLEDLDAARREYVSSRVRSLDLGDYAAWSGAGVALASMLLDSGRVSEAMEAGHEIDNAASLGVPGKTMFETFRLLGKCAVQAGRREDALGYLSRALRWASHVEDDLRRRAYYEHGFLGVQLGEFAEGAASLKAFMDLVEDREGIRYLTSELMFAWARLEADGLDGASDLVAAVGAVAGLQSVLDDDVAWAQAGLGRALWRLGHHHRGRLFLQRAQRQYAALGYESEASALGDELSRQG